MSSTGKECFDLRFNHQSNILLFGSTGSGKTVWIYNFLLYSGQMLKNPSAAKHVFLYYTKWQPLYSKMKDENLVTEFINEPLSVSKISERVSPFVNSDGAIIILDDKATEFHKDLEQLFTVETHHSNLITIATLQEIFPKSQPAVRTAGKNTAYSVIFRQLRDKKQPHIFLNQYAPGKKWIQKAYEEATSKPYSYFMIDTSQNADDEIRLRSNIYPNEFPMKIYTEESRYI